MYPKRKRKRGFEWHEKSSGPEDLDTLEEEESENSLTIHSASYRKLRLLSTSSDDSGIAIEDADSEESDTDHDSEDETDSCEEKVTGRHKERKSTYLTIALQSHGVDSLPDSQYAISSQ